MESSSGDSAPFPCGRLEHAFPGEVGRRLQDGGDVDVVDVDVLRQAQRHGREADDAAHAGAHQRAGHRLRVSGGHRDDGDARAQVPHHLLHGIGGVAAAAVDGGALQGAVGVEGGDDAQHRSPAGEVRDHRSAEAADADEHDVLPARAVQEAADALKALVHLVAAVGAAGVADGHEVAPHLGGRHAGETRELVRVDVSRPGALQVVEQAPVEAHSGDGLSGYHAVRSRRGRLASRWQNA